MMFGMVERHKKEIEELKRQHSGEMETVWKMLVEKGEELAEYHCKEMMNRMEEKPEPPAWDGDGLPPVGCECEWRAVANDWKKGYIIAKWGDRVWLATGDELKEQVWNVAVVDFRPTRSEEDRAVEEMMRELGKGKGAAGTASICRALYRAGYRKTGGDV